MSNITCIFYVYIVHNVYECAEKDLAGKHQTGNVGYLMEEEGMMGHKMAWLLGRWGHHLTQDSDAREGVLEAFICTEFEVT